MRHRGRAVFIWLLVAASVALAFVVLFSLRPRPPRVETVRLERADVEQTLILRGRLQRRVDVEVRLPLAGWVSGRVPEIGQRVAKGERLFALRSEDAFTAQVRAALEQQQDARQALRRLSRVAVPSAVAGRLLRFDVAAGSDVAAGARLATVQPAAGGAPVSVAAPVAGRLLPFLVGPGDPVGEGELPIAFLVPAQGRGDSDSPLAAQATARLLQANAELERLSLQAGRRYPEPALPPDRAYVVAPLGGEVTWRAMGLADGSPLARDAKVMSLASSEKIVLATVHEVDYPSLKPGQSVSMAFDAYPERRLAASYVSKSQVPVQSIYDQFSEYTAVFALSEAAPELVDGMSGNLTVTVAARPQVESLPVSALVRRDGRTSVWVKAAERFRSVPVEPGLVGDSRAELRSGVSATDEVVLKPEMLPKPLRATER